LAAAQAVQGAVGVLQKQAHALETDGVTVRRGNKHASGEGEVAYHCPADGACRQIQQAEPDFNRLGASVCLFHP